MLSWSEASSAVVAEREEALRLYSRHDLLQSLAAPGSLAMLCSNSSRRWKVLLSFMKDEVLP
jgi:hypothetical protein